MAPSTPEQQRMQDRVERVIGLAAPALDLVLAAGDRLSRIVGPDDDPIPIRAPGEAFALTPADRRRLESGDGGTVD